MRDRFRSATALGRLAVVLGVGVGSLSIAGQTKPAATPAPAAPVFEVYAIRYATSPGLAASMLVAGADPSRRIDIPFMIWVLKGSGGRNVLVDAG
jgi:hypothetical protein